jgi:hypothetical protein
MLCFIQQIELISNEFFTKIVRTNYCVPLKSIESTATTTNSHNNNKQLNKLFQHLFPPPPPLPLPLPSTFEKFSPLLSRHSDLSNSNRIQINTSSVPPPPPPPAPPPPPPPPPPSASSFPSRSTSFRQHLILTSPSSTPPISKFAQVRDIFARAEAAISVPTHHSIPTKNLIPSNITSSHTIPSIEQSRSPKPATVLNAVQEYQRQHINNHPPASKRFAQLGNSAILNVNRSPNIGGFRSRAIGNVGLNNNKLQNKQSLSGFTTSSLQQQTKTITRVI